MGLKQESSIILDDILKPMNNIIGKTAKVFKNDLMDDRCNISEELRWKIGDEFKICKVECLPWGTFIYNDKGQNLNSKRAKIKKEI